MANASEHAYQEIRRLVASGRYVAGDRLREEELSAAIGVSRTPVREALRRLAAEGFVEFISNRGAHVAAWSASELTDIFELRAMLEGYVARRTAVSIDDGTIERLEELATEMESLLHRGSDGDPRSHIAKLNNEFHQIIIDSAGSNLLRSATNSIVQVALVYRTFRRYSLADIQRSMDHHRELIMALRARDGGWAEAVMRNHILAARHIFDRPEPDV